MIERVVVPEMAIYPMLQDLVEKRVSALRAVQNSTAPFIVFQRTDSDRDRHINGPSGIAFAYIQIDCYAETYFAAKKLSAQVEKRLDGFKGIVFYGDDSPQDYIDIAGISLQNDNDFIDQTDDPLLYRNSASYLLTYKQE